MTQTEGHKGTKQGKDGLCKTAKPLLAATLASLVVTGACAARGRQSRQPCSSRPHKAKMGTAVDKHAAARMFTSSKPAPKAHALLFVVSILPLVVNVPANFNIVLTACLTVYAGCWRSVKPAPPTETMTKKDAMRFPIVGSCVLFGLFLAFKVGQLPFLDLSCPELVHL